MINTLKLNQDQAKKISLIQEKTQQQPEEIIRDALELYYKQLCKKESLSKPKNNLEKFIEIGFVGCIDAEPDLAENTESRLIQEAKENQ